MMDRRLYKSNEKATSIPECIPLFTLQGGIDRSRLKGVDKLMISMLTKGLAAQKQRSAQDDRMLELLSKDESYISPENLSGVLQWYKERYKLTVNIYPDLPK